MDVMGLGNRIMPRANTSESNNVSTRSRSKGSSESFEKALGHVEKNKSNRRNEDTRRSESKRSESSYANEKRSNHDSKKPVEKKSSEKVTTNSNKEKSYTRKDAGVQKPVRQSEIAGATPLKESGFNPEQSMIKKLSDKIDSIGDKAQGLVDPLTRRSAIQSFMKKMNEEHGITPLDMLEAFGSLSTDELGMPADMTVAKVVDNLDIPESEKLEANLNFQKMLKQTESASMADFLFQDRAPFYFSFHWLKLAS